MARGVRAKGHVVPATPEAVRRAARLLARGSLVAFPTETVYGLGANALDAAAVRKVFEAKGRPPDNPMIVHVSDLAMLHRVAARVPPEADLLIERFWPGPLTLVFRKRKAVPSAATAGLSTVAVRMPAHPVALELIAQAGVPVAAPSANLSGRPSPTTAAHVAEDFPGLLVLDGGPSAHGLESTVVALGERPCVLRVGAIPVEELRTLIPGLRLASAGRSPVSAESPGMKYRHYAPARPLWLFRPGAAKALAKAAAAHPDALILCREKAAAAFPKGRVVSLGKSVEETGRRLFQALRTRRKGSLLLVLGVPRRGLGRTVMDRLERAATRIF